MALLCPTAAKALTAPTETTLRALLNEYELDQEAGLLSSLQKIRGYFEYYEIVVEPDIGIRGIDDARVISSNRKSALDQSLEEIRLGETSDVEFKSTLLFDIRRSLAQPGLEMHLYRSEALEHSVLKTIAAFCNTYGGTLYVGVQDDGSIFGMSSDYQALGGARSNYDGWEQHLRSLVESRIIDGNAVNAYIKTQEVRSDDISFVKIQVASRNELTFVNKSDSPGQHLYYRSGTRSISIEYKDIEKHYELNRKF